MEAVDRAVDAVLKDGQRSTLTEVQRRLYVPIVMTPTDLVLLKYDGVRKEIEIDGAQSQRLDELWSRGDKLAPLPEDLLTAKQRRRLNQIKLQCDLMNPDAWKRARVPGKTRVFFERIRPALVLRSAARISADPSGILKELAAYRMAEVPPSRFLWGQDLTVLGPLSGSPKLFKARDAAELIETLQKACGKPVAVDWFTIDL